ncbi:MAG: HlyD family efflux transporter periplasmic adaptor subunit [Ruminococcus sp.]|jgi:multidrug resistance efflux pump|nr:HlyD family efflux transporter periplasmic adaptor subunit [Ruminococcus sp.]
MKKEKIKSAFIIFLAVMLVLTLSSNTIMNWSLPEVAVQYASWGSLSQLINGNGIVEAADTYTVRSGDVRTVNGVYVSVGDYVEEGQRMFTLKGDESEALKQARKELQTLQYDYDAMTSSTGDTPEDLALAKQRKDLEELKTKKSQIPQFKAIYDAAVKAEKNASEALENLNNQFTELQSVISDFSSDDYTFLPDSYVKQIEEIQKKIDTATDKKATSDALIEQYQKELDSSSGADLNTLRKNIDTLNNQISDMQQQITLATVANADADLTNDVDITALQSQFNQLIIDRDYATAEYNSAASSASQNTMTQTRLERESKTNADLTKEIEKHKTSLGDLKGEIMKEFRIQVKSLEKDITAAEATLGDKTEAKTEADKNNTLTEDEVDDQIEQLEYDIKVAELNLATSQGKDGAAISQQADKIKEQEDLIKELEAISEGEDITAPVGGIISEVSISSGQETAQAMTLAKIAIPEKGYKLSFSVTNAQARRVSIGTEAEIQYYWGGDLTATLSAIKGDPASPDTNKLLEFLITGDVTPGQNLRLQMGQAPQQYDTIIPNSAIREDNEGKFVLQLTAKNTPFGSRYTATRVEVEAVVTDGRNSYVTGLDSSLAVITTSAVPIKPGDQVRLANT